MHVIDSHTGGEPTRVILTGGPDLGNGSLAERARILASDHVQFCQSVLSEPRGQPAMVAALVVEPDDPSCDTGVIFFDAQAVLGMCGHGTIGLGVTLAHLGRTDPGKAKVETPVGIVEIGMSDANTVTVNNIESRRVHKGVQISIPEFGSLTGDIAYGGNWFFIVDSSPIPIQPKYISELTRLGIAVRETANSSGRGGERGEPIDHVIFQGLSERADIHGRNFVLCPDDDYDRSPCGTGCSAYLACLAADQKLAPGQEIVQESVIGSTYRLAYTPGIDGGVLPQITGQAFVMASSNLIFDPNDPFRKGIVI